MVDRTEEVENMVEEIKKQTKKKNTGKRKQKKQTRMIALAVTLISVIIGLVFAFFLFKLDMLPALYFGIVILVLALLIAGGGALIFKARALKTLIIGIVCSLLLDSIMGFGIYYMNGAMSALKKITTTKTEISLIDVYVTADDMAQTIEDANGYTFGILGSIDRENTDEAITKIQDDLGSAITTTEYDSYIMMLDALENSQIDAMILNTAYVDVLSDLEGYTDINDRIRSIAEYEIEHKTETIEKPVIEEEKDDNVFTVYISGIDSREGLISKSRSDVNILLTVNTKTKQVLMVNTPRDYYVPFPNSGGALDKLTHAGIFGVENSMGALAMLYDINVDYYFRLNFSGFENIVDALGGVDVYSEYSFITLDGGHFIQEGMNHLNGAQALGFVRERYSLPNGDHDRGKNQMKVIHAIIKKMLSTDFLMNYSNVLSALAGSFETSIPMDLMSSVVKEQLNTGGDWNIVSYAVSGTGDTQIPWSMGMPAYVMWPDQNTVDTAKTLMSQVRNGEVIEQQ